MTASSTAPHLTLVAIVRDEAPDLRRLLSWHRDLYDDAVVVDTGSLDDSATVALELGAQLTRFTWCDDFSAARNHGLERAQGDWILVLDCDELISPEDFQAVRELCTGQPTGWCFDQRNYCEHRRDPQWIRVSSEAPLVPLAVAGYVTAVTCRLFPRRADVRYEGVVHELPDQALTAAGVSLAKAPQVIHHYGYLGPAEKKRTKNVQYANLIRKKLQANPEDPKTRYEMAVQLVSEGYVDLARRLLQRTVQENPQHPETHRARLLLGHLLLADGEGEAAVRHFEFAVHTWPALREGWVETARVHVELGHDAKAARYLEQGRFLFPLDPTLKALELRITPALAEFE